MRLIPGFQEMKPGKWPRELVRALLVEIEKAKQAGTVASDLEGCRAYIRGIEPDLARPSKRSQLTQRARTLANKVAREIAPTLNGSTRRPFTKTRAFAL